MIVSYLFMVYAIWGLFLKKKVVFFNIYVLWKRNFYSSKSEHLGLIGRLLLKVVRKTRPSIDIHKNITIVYENIR